MSSPEQLFSAPDLTTAYNKAVEGATASFISDVQEVYPFKYLEFCDETTAREAAHQLVRAVGARLMNMQLNNPFASASASEDKEHDEDDDEAKEVDPGEKLIIASLHRISADWALNNTRAGELLLFFSAVFHFCAQFPQSVFTSTVIDRIAWDWCMAAALMLSMSSSLRRSPLDELFRNSEFRRGLWGAICLDTIVMRLNGSEQLLVPERVHIVSSNSTEYMAYLRH